MNYLDLLILLITSVCVVHLIVCISIVWKVEQYYPTASGRLGLIIRMTLTTAFLEWATIFYF